MCQFGGNGYKFVKKNVEGWYFCQCQCIVVKQYGGKWYDFEYFIDDVEIVCVVFEQYIVGIVEQQCFCQIVV